MNPPGEKAALQEIRELERKLNTRLETVKKQAEKRTADARALAEETVRRKDAELKELRASFDSVSAKPVEKPIRAELPKGITDKNDFKKLAEELFKLLIRLKE